MSRRTIGRRLGDPSQRGINPSQVVQDGLEKRIAFAELVRVFGEPKNSPAGMGAARIDVATAPEAQTNELQAIREELMEELRDRARNAEERAKRYEDEV